MSIAIHLQHVRQAIAQAATLHGRAPSEVQLLAVSKTFGPEAVIAAAEAGQRAFGENYVQESVDKMQAVQKMRPDLNLEWHFIGPLQSNKTRPVAENFAWVHTVDREKIAQRLSDQRPDNLPKLQICLQVNVSGELSKSGVAPIDLLPLAQAMQGLPRLTLRGLMAIPEPTIDAAEQARAFALLRSLQAQLSAAGIVTDTLSMGMSADMAAAIAEGSTMVRIGSAIFGKRDYAK
jgi:pyridoxal phosphate enzyme (YggS family)